MTSISTFFYALVQGVKNVFRNKWFSLTSLATISACLFVFGIFYSVFMNVNHIVKTVEEGVSVTVYFNEGTPQERIDQIQDLVTNRPEVYRCDFISADDAWAEFSQKLGENAEGILENPLENSENLQIYLSDVSKQADLVKYLETVEGIRKINKSELTANTLSGVKTVVGYVSVGMIVLLLAVSVFLISNTVTIGISVRKEEIGIMKYIGATDFFVRAPFVFEGIIIGIIGSAIPVVVLYFLYNSAFQFLRNTFSFLNDYISYVPAASIFYYLAPFSLAIGVGIGFFGSFFTVRKHLHV